MSHDSLLKNGDQTSSSVQPTIQNPKDFKFTMFSTSQNQQILQSEQHDH